MRPAARVSPKKTGDTEDSTEDHTQPRAAIGFYLSSVVVKTTPAPLGTLKTTSVRQRPLKLCTGFISWNDCPKHGDYSCFISGASIPANRTVNLDAFADT
jgi:hypothetical protein